MKTLSILGLFSLFGFSALARDAIAPSGDGDVSLKLEIERAIRKGVEFLETQQDAKTGSWSDPENAAISGLAVSAILGDPSLESPTAVFPVSAEKGVDFLLSQVKPDGGIYSKGLSTYNTAISMMALLQDGKGHLPVVAAARKFLVGKQQDFGDEGMGDHPFDGGIGYGDGSEAANMSTTQFTLGALYHSRQALADTEFAVGSGEDLDWEAAIAFLSRCQNSESTAEFFDGKLTVREEDEGGFVYFPASTKSDTFEIEGADGEQRTALRSYGSISYAGLLSFIYADMDRDDPRLQAVLGWLRENFTLDENPGMKAEGLYYYYHTMAKALSLAGIQQLEDPEGKEIDWKEQLALRVMENQNPDGSWINEGSNRWMEGDPVLVTAYSLLALEHVYRLL